MRSVNGTRTGQANRPLARAWRLWALCVSLAVASLVAAPVATADHAANPGAPSGACEWYGSASWERDQRVTYTSDGGFQNDHDKVTGWSGGTEQGDCSGGLHVEHRMDAFVAGNCYYAQINESVPATYLPYWSFQGEAVGLIVYFSGTDTVTYTQGWGDCNLADTQERSALLTAWCAVPGAESDAVRNTLQAVVVTCTTDTDASSEGQTVTISETYTLRMRRTVCDDTIDSDGDDLADCTEFALTTETTNPDTDGDGLSDGDEVLHYGTDPKNPDTDGDGGSDGTEVNAWGTDPTNTDTDGDGVTDGPDECKLVAGVAPSGCPSPITFTWNVAERASPDGAGNLHYRQGKWSTLLPASKLFPVTLNACSNAGTVRFTIDIVPLEPQCLLTDFLGEGEHTVTVDVLDGPNAGSHTEQIDVVHDLVVGLGDSFASGESQGAQLEWDDPNCRRAGWSAQARAAAALEKSSPHSTVTFLHLACSGATVDKGVLGPYGKPPGGTPVPHSQVRQAAALTADWAIDSVLLSVGGNDIGFAGVLSTCAAQRNCPLTKFRTDTSMNTTKSDRSLHEATEDRLSNLAGKYARVAKCLTGPGPCGASDWTGAGTLAVGSDGSFPDGTRSKVLITEYPDLATRTGGRGLKSPEGYTYCKNALQAFSAGDGIQDEEFAWAREVVQRGVAGTKFSYRKDIVGSPDTDVKLAVTRNGLNQVINAGPQGWTPVTGTFNAFGGHGYCAEDNAWVTTMKLHYIVDNKTAAFHPNRLGYKKWGQIMGNVLKSTLSD